MSVLVELELDSYTAQRLPPLALGATYDPQTALAAAWLSQLAYESALEKIDAVLRTWGLEREAIVGDPEQQPQTLTATRGVVVRTEQASLIAFAGTDPLVGRNWLTDFSAWASPDDLHAGFDGASRAVWPEVAAQARGAGAAGRTLIIAGHSLGGALACIAAKRIRDEGLADIASVYTFGMPRCGGERFAGEYGPLAQRSFRLVHGDDIVPAVPPAGLRVALPRGLEFDVGVQFRHVGRLVRSGPDKSFAGSPPTPLSQAPSNEPFLMATALNGVVSALTTALSTGLPPQAQPGWRGRFYRTLPIAIYDHLPAGYLTALGAVLTNEGL
jgi:triacylglycerol lipase